MTAFWFASATSLADPVETPESTRADDIDAQVEFILDNPLPESDYHASERCINSDSYRKVEVLDSRHLLFHGRRGLVWLNQLRYACAGLGNGGALVFQMRNRSLCDLDGFSSASGEFVRGNQVNRAGPTAPGVRCTLGHFEQITEAQANVLRKALPASQKSSKQK
ncbi:MAG TPA: hypothetical protein VIZ30_05115 [Pseudomonadales bacterium]